ncbi:MULTISPECIES: DEAD/DEAH box helicase [unclassified Curtobacterium]|uniref:DEAD/DEAH box helicase n=1 Tax=unclassified Curtobacterium TaxID=257496 RepID=UPI000DA7C5CB|nr:MULTISPECIES: DEAD/DEAH box helicase [unclassified Curtobacterium]PZE23734.1 ATP-dependent helicase [Curtobacterium sp. MCBD17_028]PZF60068.1 ATP-dependent helicase [Curtobacterium sp. MCBD17_013]PZF62633.1 ATP-dependent helicase [Curtobacterium sp. MCBD17_034]PZM33045.1 ATP-dependent helicase [Curtobacterium sp. MCBD17_031]
MVDVLTAQGKTGAFPIQVDTLPDTLAGKDVLGRGRTGSGKTLAFSIPLVARLAGDQRRRRSGHPRALVLAPTRELATQIDAVLAPLAQAMGLNTTVIFGGVSQGRQVDAVSRGVDIVVACPGRLDDLMKQGHVKLDGIEATVLDEADHMADLGFLPVVTRIMKATPADGQRLLFSATLDNGVDKLVKQFLHSPVMHSVDDASSHVDQMTHHIFEVSGADDKKDLVQVLASGSGRRIMFMRTKHHAKRLAKSLTAAGIPAVDLQGNLSQPQRDRNLARFASGDALVLVATDVAARGVHVDGVELVVHVDPPTEHKAYLHRSGRTARAGSAGDVVTVVLPEQRRDVAQMLKKASIGARPQQVTARSAAVTELVGDVAPIRHVAEAAPTQRQPQRATRSVADAVAASATEGAGRRRRRGGRGTGQGTATGEPTQGRSGGPQRSAGTRSGDEAGHRSDARRGEPRRGGQAGSRSTGHTSGGGRRAQSSVTRGGSAAVYSSETGRPAQPWHDEKPARRTGSRRASRPAGSARD